MIKQLLWFIALAGTACAQESFIKNGDSEARVREVLGAPTQAGGSGNRKTLIYGKSKVLLRDGKVISFYSYELKRELAKIRKGGHPEPKVREKPSTAFDKGVDYDAKADLDTSLSLAELKKSRGKLVDSYRTKVIAAIRKRYRGLDVIHKKREVKAANEVVLNQMADGYNVTPDAISEGFQGFIGPVRIERKLDGDMVVVSSEKLAQPLLAVGFGLQDTPIGELGVLGLLKENGTYIETVGEERGKELLIVEPVLSQTPHRGRVQSTAVGLQSVREKQVPGDEDK